MFGTERGKVKGSEGIAIQRGKLPQWGLPPHFENCEGGDLLPSFRTKLSMISGKVSPHGRRQTRHSLNGDCTCSPRDCSPGYRADAAFLILPGPRSLDLRRVDPT